MYSCVAIALSLIFSICILFSCGRNTDRVIEQTVAAANKECPIMYPDAGMRMDKVTNPEKGVMEYVYTMLDRTAEEFLQSNDIDELAAMSKKEMGIAFKNSTDSDLNVIKRANVTVRNSFYDKNGALLYSFDVTPDDYK